MTTQHDIRAQLEEAGVFEVEASSGAVGQEGAVEGQSSDTSSENLPPEFFQYFELTAA